MTAQRVEFARLIARGFSNSEACRVVGVNRRTGTRWRYGREVTTVAGTTLHYPGMSLMTAGCASTRYLSEDERVVIADGLLAGHGIRAIGRELGRPASTVSREVHRNRDEAGRYRPTAAHRMAVVRRARPKVRRLAADGALRGVVQGWLRQRWSPEQIAHTLAERHADQAGWHLVHETIYQAI